MTKTVAAIVAQMAPIIERLIDAKISHVETRVAALEQRTPGARKAGPVPYLAGATYQPGDLVQHGRFMYRALDTTIGEPGKTGAWCRVAAPNEAA